VTGIASSANTKTMSVYIQLGHSDIDTSTLYFTSEHLSQNVRMIDTRYQFFRLFPARAFEVRSIVGSIATFTDSFSKGKMLPPKMWQVANKTAGCIKPRDLAGG
jgi:hypothetical protein